MQCPCTMTHMQCPFPCRALRKAVEIIEGVQADRRKRRGGRGPRSHFAVGEDGRLHEILDTDGNDTDFDSVELMVGGVIAATLVLAWLTLPVTT